MSFPRNALTLIKSHSSKTHDLDFSSSELPRDAKPPPSYYLLDGRETTGDDEDGHGGFNALATAVSCS